MEEDNTSSSSDGCDGGDSDSDSGSDIDSETNTAHSTQHTTTGERASQCESVSLRSSPSGEGRDQRWSIRLMRFALSDNP